MHLRKLSVWSVALSAGGLHERMDRERDRVLGACGSRIHQSTECARTRVGCLQRRSEVVLNFQAEGPPFTAAVNRTSCVAQVFIE